MNAGLMAEANYILHAAGWLKGGLMIGYEKFVMDLDNCGAMANIKIIIKASDTWFWS